VAIDIGADAIDREYSVNNSAFHQTLIEGSNPAAKSGVVRKICVFLKNGPSAGVYTVGAFYKTNGNTFSSRDDWGELLNLAQGYNERTQWRYQGGVTKDIRMAVQAGDYIGVRLDGSSPDMTGLALDYDASWVNDYWRTLEETDFPYTNYEFNNLGQRIISIYGEITTIPSVTTDPATSVEATAATGNGNITDNGGEDCDKRGFVYDTSPHGDPGNTAPADSEYSNYVEETDSFGTGAFTGALTSLEPKTTYYIRAYAHNSAGYSYGNEVSFTTKSRVKGNPNIDQLIYQHVERIQR